MLVLRGCGLSQVLLTICLSVRFEDTVQGSLILVMHRLAGQEEKAWYLGRISQR